MNEMGRTILLGMLAGALRRVAQEQPIISSVGAPGESGFEVEFNGEKFIVWVTHLEEGTVR